MAFKHLLLALVMPTASYAKKRRRPKRRPDPTAMPPESLLDASKSASTPSQDH